MPRKKANTTEEVKTTRKRTTKKEKPQFSVEEMIDWSDEECKAQDKKLKFKVCDVRDIFKAAMEVNKQLADVTTKFNLLKNTISKGLMRGYKITCPHCKREYVVNSMELNRDSNVTCKVCGTEYKENESITGLEMVADESLPIKDNETVVI